VVDQEPPDQDAAAPGQRPQAKEGPAVAGTLQAVDADKNSVTISIFSRQDGVSTAKTFPVAKDAKILRDGKAVKLTDLKVGGRVTLRLSPDQKTAVSVSVAGRTSQAPLKAVDAANSTITITVETRQGKQDKTHPVAKDAKVTVDGKAVQLADLKAGTLLFFTFSAEDGNTIIQIRTAARRGREGDE
jgi:hypothetical protein